jgi:hypothetical protein
VEAVVMATEGVPIWQRGLKESEPAYAAFQHFLKAGAARTVAGTARALGTSRSLLTRWAAGHDWRARAHAWDLEQSRQDEVVLREVRESVLRRTRPQLEQVLQITLARLLRLAYRDPLTNEISFDRDFTPRAAAVLLKLIVSLLEQGSPEPPDGGAEDPTGQLRALPSAELAQLIDYIKASPEEDDRAKTPTAPEPTQ